MASGDKLEHQTGKRFGENYGPGTKAELGLLVAGFHVAEGEAANGRRPLCVKQYEQPGNAVLSADGIVAQQPTGLVPAPFCVESPAGTCPARSRQIQVSELLVGRPAYEVADVAPPGSPTGGEPGIEVALVARRQVEAVARKPIEQRGRRA